MVRRLLRHSTGMRNAGGLVAAMAPSASRLRRTAGHRGGYHAHAAIPNQCTVFALPGTAGLTGFLLGGGMIALGVLLWTQPQHHALLGVALVLTALASFL